MARRAVKPRVLVVTPDYPPAFGGVQRLMHRLVTHWDRADPRVVTLATGSDGVVPAAVRVARPRIGGRAAEIALLNAVGLRAGLRWRPDVVLSGHTVVAPAAQVLKRFFGVPYLQYVYAMEVGARPRLAARAIRHADAVIAISRHTAALAAEFCPQSRIRLLPPGVDIPKQTAVEPYPEPTIVTVSRLDERYKGHDVLLRALPLVRARVPGARLVIVGDGLLRPAYEGLASALSLETSVEFRGAVDDAERDQILARSRVFAMPSRVSASGGGEGFGIAYLEAGAHGLPVVGGDVAGARDAVINGETGVLVDPTNHVAVADAIADLLVDRPKADALGRAGAARAHEFAWPVIAAKVEDVVLELAKGTP